MAFPARVFRILIASPSDVTEERDIAVRTIQEWNDLNSAERQLVLLPLRWETHTAPEYGRRPQEVINRQVVDQCDLLVGIFWTRVGSPSGAADSGTLEEIERVATQGKPVMLYFSKAKQDPEKIEVEQLQKLREFKKKTFPKALLESYATQIEFRDKLAKQIEIQLRTLIAEQSEESSTALKAKPVTDIQLGFADPNTGGYLGRDITIETDNLEIEDLRNCQTTKRRGVTRKG
jgi:nucleoside 2-deoxyribosyltransferase